MANRITRSNASEPLRRSRSAAGSRAAKRRQKPRRLRRFLKWSFGCTLFVLLAGVATFIVAYTMIDLPDANKIAVSQTSVITYDNGKELGRIASENRQNIEIERVPKHVRHAVLAAEDRDFHSEYGFSITGYMRAAWALVTGGPLQGGSTVTQQLVKKTYLTDDRTFTRKFKELILAIKIERKLSKEEILERYLNTVYYGRGAYGIQTASKAYFDKNVGELTTGEAAVLASVIRNPSLYDPVRQPENLKHRYDYVITGMESKGWLEPGHDVPAKPPEVAEPDDKNQYRGQRGYLIQMVREELERKGISEDELLTGGYRVETTFDKKKIKYAKKAVKNTYPDELKQAGVDVGMASVKPGTGEVVAIYGGPGYLKEQLNHATRGGLTQPGSSFKPYVLATALKQGISLNTTFNGDSPQTINGHSFTNSGGHSYGYVDMATATQKSINTAYLNIGQEAGLENVVRNAKKVGYETSPWCQPGEHHTHMKPVTSLPLGPMDVCPLAQAGGIATFANKGKFVEPTTISKVTNADGDKVIYKAKPAEEKVFSSGVAADTLYGMSRVADPGGTAPVARLPDRPIAGKTGTSSQNRSAWFVGTVPQLTTTVAIYKAEGGTIPPAGGYREIFGGTIPAEVWRAYMLKATKNMEPKEFPERANVGSVKHSVPTGTATGSQSSSESPSKTPSEEPTPTPSNTPEPTEPTEPTDTPDPPDPPTTTCSGLICDGDRTETPDDRNEEPGGRQDAARRPGD